MKKVLLVLLFATACVERVLLDFGPNIELVTMAMVLSAAYVGKNESAFITLGILALTDTFLGNSRIFIFTWSGFVIPILWTQLETTKTPHKRLSLAVDQQRIIGNTLLGLSTNMFFYFWTNLGVWLIGNLYPHSLQGLLTCYINALPFLKLQLFSTAVFVPLGTFAVETVLAYLYHGRETPVRGFCPDKC